MAFFIPFSGTNVTANNCVSVGEGAASACRCGEYRARVRRLRSAAMRELVHRAEQRIAQSEAEIRAVLEGSLEALVREGAVAIVEQVFESVPEIVAQGLAERAAEVASTVLRGERGVIAVAHPLDYKVISAYLGEASLWQWRADNRCPRGEIHLHLTAGTITIRWRDLVQELVGRRATNAS